MMRLIAALALATLLASTGVAADAPEWKAGVATVDITPEKSMWMAGYASRKKPSEGTAQSLFAKALAVEDAKGTRVVIVTLDLISVPRFLRNAVEAAAREKYKLAPESLLINCSHTHSGPVTGDFEPREGYQTQKAVVHRYTDTLVDKAVETVGAALNQMNPARLEFGQGFATIGNYVDFCVVGLDPWHVHDEACRTVR